MKRSVSLVALLGLCALNACTEPGTTTGMGAAAGGVLGAGLGAIVGSSTGNAGTGLVLGAVAGSAAGASVGNVIQSQEETIRTQDEAIERHEAQIAAQRHELEELRRMDQQGPNAMLRGSSLTGASGNAAVTQPRPVQPSFAPSVPANDIHARMAQQPPAAQPAFGSVQERTLVEGDRASAMQRDFASGNQPATKSNLATTDLPNSALAAGAGAQPVVPQNAVPVGATTGALNNSAPSASGSAECTQAASEVGKARQSSELADRLFHYRRALRLCPDNAGYHNGLGEVYVALNRKADAEFEFREALRLDANFTPAQQNLSMVR